MSVFWLAGVMDLPCNPAARLVLMSIADQAQDDGFSAPVLDRLGLNRIQMRRAVQELVVLGYVEKGENVEGRETFHLFPRGAGHA